MAAYQELRSVMHCQKSAQMNVQYVKSRETNFYYGHKQNRFWKVLAALFQEPIPETIDEKKHLLLEHHIAIWDVIQSCDIKGSSDHAAFAGLVEGK